MFDDIRPTTDDLSPDDHHGPRTTRSPATPPWWHLTLWGLVFGTGSELGFAVGLQQQAHHVPDQLVRP